MARTEDALVLGLVGAGILRSHPRGNGIVAGDWKIRRFRCRRGVSWRLVAPVDMQFVQPAVGVGVRLERAPGAISGTVPASFALALGAVSKSRGAVQRFEV